MGINNKTSNWIGAWLSHRFQRVVVHCNYECMDEKTIDDRISEAMTTVSFLESMIEQTYQTLYSKDPEVSKIL
jgi:hypothetical protein